MEGERERKREKLRAYSYLLLCLVEGGLHVSQVRPFLLKLSQLSAQTCNFPVSQLQYLHACAFCRSFLCRTEHQLLEELLWHTTKTKVLFFALWA